MKAMFALTVLACVASMALADNYGYYKPGFRRVYNGVAAIYNNAERQEKVNYRAEHVAASSGTARYDGVPGTGNNYGYHGYNRRYDRGYNRGYDGHDQGYGRDSYGYGY